MVSPFPLRKLLINCLQAEDGSRSIFSRIEHRHEDQKNTTGEIFMYTVIRYKYRSNYFCKIFGHIILCIKHRNTSSFFFFFQNELFSVYTVI